MPSTGTTGRWSVLRDERTSDVAIWSFAVNGVPSRPSVIDGRVFVGTDLGKVIAIGGSGSSPSP